MPVVIEMTADEQRVWRAMQRLEAKGADVERKLKELGRAGKKSGKDVGASFTKANKDSFGPQAVQSLSRYATGLVTIGAAVGTITAAFREADQVAKRFAENQRSSEFSLSQLYQLPGGAQRVAQARQLYSTGGAASLSSAGQTVFSLASADLGSAENLALFGRLFPTVQDPGTLAKSITTSRTTFGGREVGTLRQQLSKAFAASAVSPATVEALAAATARSGVSASRLGVSDEEVAALTALLAKATTSAEEGGTQASAFFDVLVKKGFHGKSVLESARSIQRLGLSDPELIQFFGRKEGFKAFGTLVGNTGEYQRNLSSIIEAERGDLVGQKIREIRRNPEFAAARLERITKAREELGGTGRGIRRQLYEAAVSEDVRLQRERGIFEPLIQVERGVGGVMRYIFGQDAMLETPRLSRTPGGRAAAALDQDFAGPDGSAIPREVIIANELERAERATTQRQMTDEQRSEIFEAQFRESMGSLAPSPFTPSNVENE